MEKEYILFFCVILTIVLVIVVNRLFFIKKATYNSLNSEYQKLLMELTRARTKSENLEEYQNRVLDELESERSQRIGLEKERERILVYSDEKEKRIREHQLELEKLQRQFKIEFQNLANTILEEKSNKFVALNQKNIDSILSPLKEKIETFEKKVDQTYQQEAAERNILKGVVEQLMQQSLEIRNEANNLTKALKGDSKKQGNWGEVILERVLERSGLTKDREYRLQVSLNDGEGKRLLPDAIIDLPDQKNLVVDSKVSLTAYERWISADNDEERNIAVKQHVISIENHVKELSSKNYHQLYGINSPDFVLLFMPIESALSLAVTEKPEIFGDAWERKVVIVSPSTLLATLRTIASIWKQELQNQNVMEIAKEAGKLYDKFVGFLKDMEQVQSFIDRASQKHEEATKKLSSGPGNIVRRVENLKSLGAKANKQIENKYLDR